MEADGSVVCLGTWETGSRKDTHVPLFTDQMRDQLTWAATLYLQHNEQVHIDVAHTHVSLARPKGSRVVQPTTRAVTSAGSRFPCCCSANCDRVFALANNLSRPSGLHTASSQHLKHFCTHTELLQKTAHAHKPQAFINSILRLSTANICDTAY